MEKRVVITGLGVISSVGNDIPTFWNNLLNGVCGIQTITDFPTDDLPVKIGGRVKDFDPDRYGIDKAFMRKQDWFWPDTRRGRQQHRSFPSGSLRRLRYRRVQRHHP